MVAMWSQVSAAKTSKLDTCVSLIVSGALHAGTHLNNELSTITKAIEFSTGGDFDRPFLKLILYLIQWNKALAALAVFILTIKAN